jgi:Transposase DNA-binding
MKATYDLRRSFGQEHFGAAKLGDRRRTQRLAELADRVRHHPAGTMPHKLLSPADLKAFYRLCNNRKVTHESVLAPHRAWTLQRMAAHQGVVLIVHDASELDYTKKKSLEQLGQIGSGHRRGYLAHHSLAIDPEHREVIGLVNQILHRRRRVRKGETQRQRRSCQNRESRLWLRGAKAVGPVPKGSHWVDVCDRGADTFEFLEYELQNERRFVIRSAYSRRLVTAGAKRQYLHTLARQQPVWGQRTVVVAAQKGQAAREATVGVSATPVVLKAPCSKNGEHDDDPLALWMVRVWELQAPPGQERLEWLLLTNEPVENYADALRVVGWYECRPLVEEFHKAIKTGMRIESLQFKSEGAQEPAIAFLSVMGLTLLKLRELARRPETRDRPATTVLSADHVAVLSAWRYGKPRRLTIAEFQMALGRLGGHQNRKGDGLPGWLVLWRGWMELQAMMEGARLARPKRCG